MDSDHRVPRLPGLPPGTGARLSLDAGRVEPGLRLPLEIQSISPAGLAVLTAAGMPTQVDRQTLGDPQEGAPLTFVLEKDGHDMTLQASLVWMEMSNERTAEQRLELIVDTGDQPGWWEVQSALAPE